MALTKISFSDVCKVSQNNKIHDMLLHIWLSASQEWLNTVHRVVQIQIKGSCCYALDFPAELSAKIVQVLFHFYHTEEIETKEQKGKRWMYEVTIYSEQNVLLSSDKSRWNTAHWHRLVHEVWPVQSGEESTSFSGQVRSKEI